MVAWPKIFHRIWLDEEERPGFAAWRDKLAELHPDWEIRTWQDSGEARKMLTSADLLPLWDRYIESDPFGRIPDILRYSLLYRFGGVYIDTDFEPLRPIDELLDGGKPFAAWENDRTMCTAILGSPPKHPAVKVLLTGLPDSCARTEEKTPNYATGPEYATSLWRGRSDVKRLPPWTFYPVGWWERHLLGDPANYHPDTFAVHHWAKGWGDDAQENKIVNQTKAVILVPLRIEDEERTLAWEYTRFRLEELGLPIVTADSDGPWNRSAAINKAAAEAEDWDVALIADADTIGEPDAIRKAMTQALKQESAVIPWRLRHKLSRDGSDRMRRYEDKLPYRHRLNDRDHTDKTPSRLPMAHRGGPIVVSRAAWDAVGGFDEEFVGWGHEDVAFRIACETLAPGGLSDLNGTIWHLWHERTDPSQANDQRKELYRAAAGDPMALRSLVGSSR